MFGGLLTIASLKLFALPIIQNVIASGIYEYLKTECLLPSDTLSLTFDNSVKEALCRAVKKSKKIDRDDAEIFADSEFRFYFKVLKDDLINLEPIDRKTYINQNLYKTFVDEVKKSPTAMRHLSFRLIRHSVSLQRQALSVIEGLSTAINQTLSNTEEILSKEDVISRQVEEVKITSEESRAVLEEIRKTLKEQSTLSVQQVSTRLSGVISGRIASLIDELKINTASSILDVISNCFTEIIDKQPELKADILFQKAKILTFKNYQQALQYLDEAHTLYPDEVRFDKSLFRIWGEDFNAEVIYEQPYDLSFSNLNAWMCYLLMYRFKDGDYIQLSKEAPQRDETKEAYNAANTFIQLLEKTEVSNCFPVVKCLFHYWGYLTTWEEFHVSEYLSIPRNSFGEQTDAFNYMELSLLLLSGKHDKALEFLYRLKDSTDEQFPKIGIMVAMQLQNTDALKWLLMNIHEHGGILNMEETTLLCHAIDSLNITDEVAEKVKEVSSNSPEAKTVLLEYMNIKLGKVADMNTIATISDGLPNDLKVYKALILCKGGKVEDAYNIIKKIVDLEPKAFTYHAYIDILASDKIYASELYEAMKAYRHNGYPFFESMWKSEYNKACILADDKNALEVIEDLYHRNPEDNEVYCQYLLKIGDVYPEKLGEWEESVLKHELNFRQAATIYQALAGNGYIETAAELIFRHAIATDDFGIRNFYHSEAISGKLHTLAYQEYETAEEGLYALCDVDGKRPIYKLEHNSIIGSKLIGLKRGERVKVETEIGKVCEIEIIAIYNKYGKLACDILKNAMDGNNPGMRPFTLNMEKPVESLNEMITALNHGDITIKKQKADLKKEYDIGKAGLCQMVDRQNPIPKYFELLFSSFKIQVVNTLEFISLIKDVPEESKFILDLPSVLTFAEFSSLTGLEIMGEMHVTSNLQKIIDETYKISDQISLSDMYQVIPNAFIKHFDERVDIDTMKHLAYLRDWVNHHCKIDIATQTLSITPELQNIGSWLISTIAMLIDQSFILVTDDVYLASLLPGCKIISTETYVALNCRKEVLQIYSKFLLKNNFVGTIIDADFIVDEYKRMTAGEGCYWDKITIALEYNPLLLTNVITAILELFQTTHIGDLLIETSNNLLAAVLRGYVPEKRKDITNMVISEYNYPLPAFRFIRERMKDALTLVNRESDSKS
jgi:tetratricopeptide (TPR) repeat protein